jgi:glycine/D-amino acid oxidase-like deaminating enzyme
MPELDQQFDVLVVGGGNAGLCAAIGARRAGARVLLLEAATKDFRGGNSRHTRDIRYMHPAATNCVTDAYREAEFWNDLQQVTGGETKRVSCSSDDSWDQRTLASGWPQMMCAGKGRCAGLCIWLKAISSCSAVVR